MINYYLSFLIITIVGFIPFVLMYYNFHVKSTFIHKLFLYTYQVIILLVLLLSIKPRGFDSFSSNVDRVLCIYDNIVVTLYLIIMFIFPICFMRLKVSHKKLYRLEAIILLSQFILLGIHAYINLFT